MSELDSEFYNLTTASEQLSSLIEDCRQVSQESGQGIQLANADLSGLFVQQYQNPSSWRLTRLDEHGMNEIVEYRVQGVISDKLLPPIGALKNNNAVKQCSHLRQAVSITGLGSPLFDAVIPTIENIFFLFVHYLPPDSIEFWKPQQFHEYDAICARTRLFTSRTQVVGINPISFDPLVDSNENLARLARMSNARFIHTTDNAVEYLGPINGGNGLGNVSPNIYRAGDIVELSVSFVVWPSSRGKTNMNIQLHSMRMLNNKETNVSFSFTHDQFSYLTSIPITKNAKMNAMIAGNRRVSGGILDLPKRKRTYNEEERVAETQHKLSKMKIDARTEVDPPKNLDALQPVDVVGGTIFSL